MSANELKHPKHPDIATLVGNKPTGELRWIKRGNETILQQERVLSWQFSEEVWSCPSWTTTDTTIEWIDTQFYTKPADKIRMD